MLTPGQARDVQGFAPLFRMIGERIEAFLADRCYNADSIRDEIASADIEAVIPAKVSNNAPLASEASFNGFDDGVQLAELQSVDLLALACPKIDP